MIKAFFPDNFIVIHLLIKAREGVVEHRHIIFFDYIQMVRLLQPTKYFAGGDGFQIKQALQFYC
ncbi:hypothetical protein CW745_09820 [Psychromonas sp. psych-6C06]|nr:hypothetical protein CW745_09820 [Psychromonas sp. psych-6C06]